MGRAGVRTDVLLHRYISTAIVAAAEQPRIANEAALTLRKP